MRRLIALAFALAAVAALFASPAAHGKREVTPTEPLPNVAAAGPVSPLIGHSGFRNMPVFLNTTDEAEHLTFLGSEAEMGLKWSFTALIWAGFEPHGPTDASFDPTGAWARLDRWVEAARGYGIHLLIQPVMTGNGVAPPAWAGYRTSAGYTEAQTWTDPWGQTFSKEEGYQPWNAAKPSIPRDMDALANWYGKLAARYKPGGQLAQEKGWTDGYGVRVWEVDNEPDAYGLWLGAHDDYAEVLTRAAQAVKAEDPLALVLGAALAQDGSKEVLRAVLDKRTQLSTLEYQLNGEQYAIGPFTDVIAFHHYNKVDASGVTVFGGGSSLEETIPVHKAWWDFYSDHPEQPEFHFPKGKEMWHTEGGLDYSGSDDEPYSRSRAFIQYLVRGFAAGFDRMTVQDMHEDNESKANGRRAVKTFLQVLPHAASLESDSAADAPVRRFRADDGVHWTYVLWSGSGLAETTSVPVRTSQVRIVGIYGEEQIVDAVDGFVTLTLPAASPAAPPVYVIETGAVARSGRRPR